MARKVILSSLGIDIQEAEILEFKKKEGDKVKRGDIIADVESQKVSFEVVSPADGVILKIFYKEKDIVKVGEIIAIVGEENEDISEYIKDKDDSKKNIQNVEKRLEKDSNKKIKAYPNARKLSEQFNVDLSKIKASEESGVITKKDVEEYLKKINSRIQNGYEGYQVIEFTGLRKTIADRMLSSVRNAAHVTTFIEVDMTNVREVREEYKRTQGNISYMAFIIKAIANGIKFNY